MTDHMGRPRPLAQPRKSHRMDRSKQVRSYLKHTVRDSSRAVAFGAAVAVVLAVLLAVWTGFTDTWSRVLDPVLTAVTTGLALAIWMSTRRRAWIEQLPRRISVHFTIWTKNKDGSDEEVYLMSCLESTLASGSDERAWAQHLGQQMNHNAFLKFHPYFKRSEPEVREDELGEYLLHELTYQLSEVPKYFTDHQASAPSGAREHRLDEPSGGSSTVRIWYRVWFDNLPNTPRNKRLYTANLPTKRPWTTAAATSHFESRDSLHEPESEGTTKA